MTMAQATEDAMDSRVMWSLQDMRECCGAAYEAFLLCADPAPMNTSFDLRREVDAVVRPARSPR